MGAQESRTPNHDVVRMLPKHPGWFDVHVKETNTYEVFRFLDCGCRVGTAHWGGTAGSVDADIFREPCSRHHALGHEPV